MYSNVLINNETNIVDNIIRWDGVSNWTAPDGYTVIKIEETSEVGIGFSYINGVFEKPDVVPVPSKPTPTLSELQVQLLAISQQMAALANTSG
jgi:hypothetical protein